MTLNYFSELIWSVYQPNLGQELTKKNMQLMWRQTSVPSGKQQAALLGEKSGPFWHCKGLVCKAVLLNQENGTGTRKRNKPQSFLSIFVTNQCQPLCSFSWSRSAYSLIAFLPYCHVDPLCGLHSTFWAHKFSSEPSRSIAPRSILIQINTERTSAGGPQWPCCK